MKKILSSLLIFGLLFSTSSSLFADDSYAQYFPRVQNAIENMTPAEVKNFQKKIATTIHESDNLEIKDFLKSILLLTAQEDAIDAVQDKKPIITEEVMSITPLYTELSGFEQSRVATQISKLQGDLKDETTRLGDQMIASWNKLTRYTERGSLKAEMDIEVENLLSLKAGMDISDYLAKNQNLDSSISANIDGFYNLNGAYGDQIDVSGKTNLEFIQKGADSYLLMRNTEFSSNDEDLEIELTPMIEKLTELAKDNTYISLADENSIDPLEILGYFYNGSIELEINEVFSQNLMQAYGKNKNGYLLEPTKHFCDMGKRITSIFDPFNGKDCSENQYQSMLKDFRDSGVEIALEIGSDITLSISDAAASDAYETTDIELIWKNASFREMNMSITDNQDDIEYFMMQYIANDLLTIRVPKQAYDPEFMLDMKLGRNGNIKNIDVLSSYEDDYIFTGTYNNGSIKTNLEIDIPDLTASCEFSGNAYTSYINISGGCYIISNQIQTDSQNLRIDSSMLYNGQASNNDFTWDLNAISDASNYLKFNVQSSAKRKSTGIYKISAPTSTINYLDFLREVSPKDAYYYDEDLESEYEYEYNTYDEYDEACYIYESGDTTCYEYYDDKEITCDYVAETDEEICETYDYGYTSQESSYDDYDEVCYLYDTGEKTCYEYYDDKELTCEYESESSEKTYETYQYDDDYYYDGIEDAEEAFEE